MSYTLLSYNIPTVSLSIIVRGKRMSSQPASNNNWFSATKVPTIKTCLNCDTMTILRIVRIREQRNIGFTQHIIFGFHTNQTRHCLVPAKAREDTCSSPSFTHIGSGRNCTLTYYHAYSALIPRFYFSNLWFCRDWCTRQWTDMPSFPWSYL